ncbi:hypothetical protein L209DRAFT_710006 [Thermothelomyces heterothallicus CBS 203.75]
MASTGAAAQANNGGGAPDNAPSGPRGGGHRGKGRGRGRGGRPRGRGRGGSHHGGTHNPPAEAAGEPASDEPKAPPAGKQPNFKIKNDTRDEGTDGDVEVCFICANPISHHSVAPCNHVTCHICSLRLRALYKNKDCPHCRTTAPFVIFTDDGKKRFEEYTDADITSTDENIGIRYAGEDIVGDTVLLLRYNCPDAECDFAGLGWQDLHRHVRNEHRKKMCDLCTRNKKVFTHEHDIFTDKQLTEHMRRGDDKPGAADQTGFRGHPLCGFCGERFYDSDKLYEHCRNKHERCFICDRHSSQPQYYLDYNELEKHFKEAHFLCLDRNCLEKKFVVFETALDLKAHQLEEHGDVYARGRESRVVDLSNFDLRQRYEQERRAGGNVRERRRRGPDPNAEPLPVSSAQPLRRDELAFQRQMALQTGATRPAPPGPSRPTPSNAAPQPRPPASSGRPLLDAMENLSITDLSNLTPEQRASLTRHGAVIERASNLLGNDATKMATFRSHVSTYNKGSMTPEQLIDAFFALFSETSSNALGTVVREVADLFEDKKKGEALRKAWNNWRAINEDYPSLPSLEGMRGATTSTTGWAAAAAASSSSTANPAANAAAQLRHSTRVLKLKNSTRRGSVGSVMSLASGAPSSSTPAPSVSLSTPFASAAGGSPSASVPSAAAFPALPGASRPSVTQPTWIGGSTPAISRGAGSGALPPPQRSQQAGKTTSVPGNSEEAFPALPAAPKPQTTIFGYGRGAVRRDFGTARETGFSWGAGGSGSNTPGTPQTGVGADGGGDGQQQQGGAGGGKKKKKQVLVQWG